MSRRTARWLYAADRNKKLKSKIMKTRTFILSAVTVAAGFMPGGVDAQTAPVSGTSGTCTWSIANETLTISAGTLADWTADGGTDAPWHDAAGSIRSIKVEDGCHAATLARMFADMPYLQSMDIYGLDMSGVANMAADMFSGTQCPRMFTLPAYAKTKDDSFITLPEFDVAEASRVAQVGNGTALSPAGGTFVSTQAMVGSGYKYGDGARHTYVLEKTLDESVYTLNSVTGYGTLCYPVDVNFYDDDREEWLADAYKATGLKDVDGSRVVVLTPYYGNDGTIPANTPVMLFRKGGTADVEIKLNASSAPVSIAPVTVAEQGSMLVGCNGAVSLFGTVDGSADRNKSVQYVYQNHSGNVQFYRVDPAKPIHMPSYRCYLQLPESAVAEGLNAPAMPSNFDDGATGIGGIADGGSVLAHRKGIYDLSGRRVDEMKTGVVYIVDGVKMMVGK